MTQVNTDREILPSTVTPSHYVVNLTPDLDSFTFDGIVDITVKVNEATKTIKVNTNELKLQSASVTFLDKKNEASLKASSITYDEKVEQSTLHFDKDIAADTAAVLHIEFTGEINDKMAGFYRSGYTDPEGNKKFMAVTQFEATDARRCFPCWDEPAVKATFDVTLNVADRFTALSNMNVAREEKYAKKSGHKSVHFARTPIMSTYLVAFAVGELDYVETTTSPSCKELPNPVTVRVYTSKGLSAQGKFALGCAARTLEYFSKVFGEPYPLPKMDMIAVPDFAAGAMENWGLVTYRTIYLLFDDKTSSARSKEGIAYVVAHELAHQWFGNLVTMQWWDELWLNEGFATWVGWLAVDHMFPEWDIWTKFVLDDMGRALSLDALRNSHPIQVPVKSPSEINQIFDAISYSKGASVIRMLSSWLTVDTFLEGIRRYIKKFRYSNASTNDLWAALSDASGVDVSSFMDVWTKATGYPVLKVEDGEKEIKVTQSRFLSSGGVTAEEDKTVWWCPLAVWNGDAKALEGYEQVILKTKSASVPKAPNATSEPYFFKLNYKQPNIYRVQYSPEAMDKIGKAIAHGGRLQTTDRVGLVSDAFALAGAGYISTVDALNLVGNFHSETEYVALGQIADRLGAIKTIWALENKETKDRLDAFIRQIFSEIARKAGFTYPEGEGHLQGMTRTLAIARAGLSGDEHIIKESQRRFESFVNGDESAIHPNLRGTVFAIALKHGGRKEYEAVKKIWESNIAADQKLVALGSLGHTPDETILREILAYALDESNVRPQDFVYPLGSVAANPLGRRIAWDFVKENWSLLVKRFDNTLSLLSRCVSITSDWASHEFANELEEFFKDKETKSIDRTLKQSLEKIRQQADWLQRDRQHVDQWLAKNVKA
ncbi:hypothetical protein RI367_001471 [Sorochytrium milnesiophthora]